MDFIDRTGQMEYQNDAAYRQNKNKNNNNNTLWGRIATKKMMNNRVFIRLLGIEFNTFCAYSGVIAGLPKIRINTRGEKLFDVFACIPYGN